VIPSLAGGVGGELPPVGGRPFRTNRRLLAMSALMSASAYFRLLPPRPATCSSIASFTVLLCAALVLEDIWQQATDLRPRDWGEPREGCGEARAPIRHTKGSDTYMLPLCAFQSLLGERRSIQGGLPSFCWCRAA
jgi:hypothetical protein